MNDLEFYIIASLVKIGIVLGAVMGAAVPGMVYLERRIVAFMQQRLGPNRVGPFGLFQPIADAIKLMWKEDITPSDADKFLYFLRPGLWYLLP